MDLYKVLQRLMDEKKLKIADVARICNLPDSTVRGILTRKQKSTALDVAFRLADGLGVSLEYLNTGEIKEMSTAEIDDRQESKDIGPQKQALLDAAKEMDEESAKAVLGMIRYVKSLRDQ